MWGLRRPETGRVHLGVSQLAHILDARDDERDRTVAVRTHASVVNSMRSDSQDPANRCEICICFTPLASSCSPICSAAGRLAGAPGRDRPYGVVARWRASSKRFARPNAPHMEPGNRAMRYRDSDSVGDGECHLVTRWRAPRLRRRRKRPADLDLRCSNRRRSAVVQARRRLLGDGRQMVPRWRHARGSFCRGPDHVVFDFFVACNAP